MSLGATNGHGTNGGVWLARNAVALFMAAALAGSGFIAYGKLEEKVASVWREAEACRQDLRSLEAVSLPARMTALEERVADGTRDVRDNYATLAALSLLVAKIEQRQLIVLEELARLRTIFADGGRSGP